MAQTNKPIVLINPTLVYVLRNFYTENDKKKDEKPYSMWKNPYKPEYWNGSKQYHYHDEYICKDGVIVEHNTDEYKMCPFMHDKMIYILHRSNWKSCLVIEARWNYKVLKGGKHKPYCTSMLIDNAYFKPFSDNLDISIDNDCNVAIYTISSSYDISDSFIDVCKDFLEYIDYHKNNYIGYHPTSEDSKYIDISDMNTEETIEEFIERKEQSKERKEQSKDDNFITKVAKFFGI